MGEFLSREQILAVQDCKIEEVDVPEWDGTVRVKALSGTERDQIEAMVLGKSGKGRNYENLRARMVALTVVNESGERIFETNDVTVLGSKNARALDRIFDVAQRLSGMTAKDVEELVGKSKPDPSDVSFSD
jgi:hypothetical protein